VNEEAAVDSFSGPTQRALFVLMYLIKFIYLLKSTTQGPESHYAVGGTQKYTKTQIVYYRLHVVRRESMIGAVKLTSW